MSRTHNIFTSYMIIPESDDAEFYTDALREMGYPVDQSTYGDIILFSRGSFGVEARQQFVNSYGDDGMNKVEPIEFLNLAKEFEG